MLNYICIQMHGTGCESCNMKGTWARDMWQPWMLYVERICGGHHLNELISLGVNLHARAPLGVQIKFLHVVFVVMHVAKKMQIFKISRHSIRTSNLM
jgi:hypothetical protein